MNYNTKQFTPEEVIKQMMWLAWKSSSVFGLGALHDFPSATKDQVWDNVKNSGDYISPSESDGKRYTADYVFGRCMKLTIGIEDENTIRISSYLPNDEHQTWARRYPSFDELAAAALRTLSSESDN